MHVSSAVPSEVVHLTARKSRPLSPNTATEEVTSTQLQPKVPHVIGDSFRLDRGLYHYVNTNNSVHKHGQTIAQQRSPGEISKDARLLQTSRELVYNPRQAIPSAYCLDQICGQFDSISAVPFLVFECFRRSLCHMHCLLPGKRATGVQA